MQGGFVLRLFFFILFQVLLTQTKFSSGATEQPPRYNATDFFLLNCAASSKATFDDGSEWDTDNHYLQFMPPNTAEVSFQATAETGPSVQRIPYSTARVFTSEFTYSFRISPGPKFLRLYFFPGQYSKSNSGSGSNSSSSSGLLKPTQFFFSVTANNHTLLKNFSASLTVSGPASPDRFIIKREFIVNVDEKQQVLNLTFSPTSSSYYGFVNGIEIVSMPSDLYLKGDSYPIPMLVGNTRSEINIDSYTTLETMYRLNVGGSYVGRINDTGMFREWDMDNRYVDGVAFQTPGIPEKQVYYTPETPAYTAPDIVYLTSRTMANESDGVFWKFPVDAGFSYLFRLYFCEFQLEMNYSNYRVFSIDINNSTADKEADVFDWVGRRKQVPVIKEYVVLVGDDDAGGGRRRRKQNVSLSMRPNMNTKAVYANTILNGLEIFKLNDTSGSLAVPNPNIAEEIMPPAIGARMPEKNKGWVPIVGGVVGGIALLVIISTAFLIFRRRWNKAADPAPSVTKSSWVPMPLDSTMSTQKTEGSTGSNLPLDLCRHFSLDELKLATANFNQDFIIGKGGFGNVYRGYIDNVATAVAIKRLKPESNQGFREFQTEIILLSNLRHVHLVSLIGYCDHEGEMILVYDYMSQGTLRDHLYKSDKPPISWKQRLKACIGAAKGLHYLHAGARRPIIHRDIKSTNILLDDKWVAKLSDFGLSKVGPLGSGLTHVSTMVKGSFGYVDPEYYRRQQVTQKSDVYSFGVVLFEVLCGRPAVNPNLPKHQINLAGWGRQCYETGAVGKMVDPNLKGQISPECLNQFVEIAYNCLKDKGIDRPAMSDVVWSLEFALQLQDAAEKSSGGTLESPSFPLLGNSGCHDAKAAADNADDDGGDEFSTTTDDKNNSFDEFRTKSSVTATTSFTSDSRRGQSHTVFSELNNQLGR